MIVEMTVEKGTSLQDLANRLGWNTDKLIEANGGLASPFWAIPGKFTVPYIALQST